jgi:hypothetical protein
MNLTVRIKSLIERNPELGEDVKQLTKIVLQQDCDIMRITTVDEFIKVMSENRISNTETIKRILKRIKNDGNIN